MKKLPLSYWIQLISGLFALFCIPMIFIAEGTGWFGDELIHLPQWTAILICFIAGVRVHLKKGVKLGRFHGIVSGLGVVLSGMFLILFAILMWVLIEPDIINSIKYRKFDSQVWKQSDNDHMEGTPRIYMADDLIRDKTLEGLTEEEVVEMLGEPYPRDPIDGSTFPGGAYDSDIHYYLGPQRGFMALDSEWLMIAFGEDGKVNRYWLYSD